MFIRRVCNTPPHPSPSMNPTTNFMKAKRIKWIVKTRDTTKMKWKYNKKVCHYGCVIEAQLVAWAGMSLNHPKLFGCTKKAVKVETLFLFFPAEISFSRLLPFILNPSFFSLSLSLSHAGFEEFEENNRNTKEVHIYLQCEHRRWNK